MTTETPTVPNHHRDYPAFSGINGYLAGLTMIAGRGEVAELAAELTQVSEGDRVVDVGCGPGVAARAAARRGAIVTGVDPAAPMLAMARRLTRHRDSIAWLVGTAEHLPQPDHSATVLWSIATVHHWRDIDMGIAEAIRVLLSDGRLLAIERRTRAGASGHASHGWTYEQAEAFAARCRAAGLLDVRTDETTLRKKTLLSVRAIAP